MAYIVSIAGSDSSGGAGNQADVSCIAALGHHALSVITAITAQDVNGVKLVACSDEVTIQAQLSAVFSSFDIDAVKSGMLPTNASIEALATTLRANPTGVPYVLDPVMVASSGTPLNQENTVATMVQHLFPLATLVTPNISEAERLSGQTINTTEETVSAGQQILAFGCRAVLIKGGHSKSEPGVDVFLDAANADTPYFIHDQYIADRSPRGTGCAYASAIACGLASQLSLYESIRQAKRHITLAIANADRVAGDFWLLNHHAAVAIE